MRSKMLTVAIAAGLGLTSVTATVSAQTSNKKVTVSAAELAQMKAEIAALEQKVQDLESQQTAQQQAQVETAQSVQATQAEVQATQKQVVAAQKHTGDILGGTGGVKWTFGGFLAAESAYRSRDTADDISTKFTAIPFQGGTSTAPINTSSGATTTYPVTNARNSQFVYSARQSRLSIKAEGDINDTTHVTGYYEMDFLGGAQTANMNESNSFNMRTRQLWANIDWADYGVHALAGQAWSLMTLDSVGITAGKEVLPPTIDAQYGAGFNWARQTQLRLVKDWNKMWWLGISVENPQTAGIGASAGPGTKGYATATATVGAGSLYDTLNTVSLNERPDILVKFAADPGWGHYELFGISREFTTRVTPTAANGGPGATTNQTAHGGGFGFGMLLPLVPKTLDFQLSGMAGKGIGRYGTSGLNDITYTTSGAPHPLKENMVLGTLTWHATDAFDVYVEGGREQQDSYQTVGVNGLPLGYGASALGYNNSNCLVYGAATNCNGQTRSVKEETLGFFWKFYQGKFGRLQFGTQFSHLSRQLFTDSAGNAPKAADNMFFTSFRYYPF
jgi:cell division protein FtsB